MNSFDNTATYARPPVDEWYVYQDTGNHDGPLTLEALVQNLVRGAISRGAFAGFAGEGRWRPMMEIPEVAAALHSFEMACRPSAPTPPSARIPQAPRVPSSMAPPAPPLGFAAPPRVAQISEVTKISPQSPRAPQAPDAPPTPVVELQSSADETIPAPSNPPPPIEAPRSFVSSSAPTGRADAFAPSPIPASLPPRPPQSPLPPAPPASFVAPSLPRPAPMPMPMPMPMPSPVVATMPAAVVSDKALAEALPLVPVLEKKDILDPRLRLLPFAIFGACAFVAAIEVVVGLILG